jgi:hypothetical protein
MRPIYGVFLDEDGGHLEHLFVTKKAAEEWIEEEGYVCHHTGKNWYYVNELKLFDNYSEYYYMKKYYNERFAKNENKTKKE